MVSATGNTRFESLRHLTRSSLSTTEGPYDIAAGQLVASSASGNSSYPLLDGLGCPTDPTTFPAMSKDPADGKSLVTTFAAFKFPDSQLVRFNVIVRFCADECMAVSRVEVDRCSTL